MKSKFKLGDRVKNRLTRRKGYIKAIVFYDSGLVSYNVQPIKRKDEWYDEIHLKLSK